jgi:hypothetical protein
MQAAILIGLRRGVLLLVMALSGCSTLPDGRLWGGDATLTPGWDRVRESAINAGRDPWVWAPLLGSALIQIDDWDHRVSDWAREHTPVFSSTHNAEQWSDDLRDASVLAHYATVVATPGGDDPGEWIMSKARGTLVGVAAVSSTVLVTRTLKTGLDRDRPNGLAEESFPSGHTSSSAVHTRLASRNLRSIAMSDGMRTGLDVGLTALTIGTSWARIEAGWHYPSDTLFGMALGNFLASFFNDAFMGLEDSTSSVAFRPAHDGGVIQWSWRF